MYYYALRSESKKNRKWVKLSEEEVTPESLPAYQTVLKIDKDVDTLEEAGKDVNNTVKYLGPMYFDLDCKDDIDAVLESSRTLIRQIQAELDIDARFIRCWLSGGKGVHITLSEKLFGITRPVKHLPIIYKQIARRLHVNYLDMGVYSEGKGRMWRNPGHKRENGAYKVPVTVEQLMIMNSVDYGVYTQHEIPEFPEPASSQNTVSLTAKKFFAECKKAADKEIKDRQRMSSVPIEKVREMEEVPGCIKKLLTEGDCEDSNFNQAAMQTAAWIGAKYHPSEKDRYEQEVMKPFLANVTSSSKTFKECEKDLKSQVHRAFQGRTKFEIGPLMAVLGEPCGECVLCRPDMNEKWLKGEDPLEDAGMYDKATRIKATSKGYFKVTNNSEIQLTSFLFIVDSKDHELKEDQRGLSETNYRVGMTGTLYSDEGEIYEDFYMPESAWGSKANMVNALKGRGYAAYLAGEAELPHLMRAVLRFSDQEGASTRKGTDKATNSAICGIFMDRKDGELLPTHIEVGGSVVGGASGSLFPSRFSFDGQHTMSPRLIDEEMPEYGDRILTMALRHLFKSNTPDRLGKIVGWFAACFLREHLCETTNQFPMLNVWGNAGSGKTQTVGLISQITGVDYIKAHPPLNMENSTVYPLVAYITSSTTVPRFVEEVNEPLMDRSTYKKVAGLLKASWDKSTVPRGYLANGEVKVDPKRVTSPIVYVSEQRASMPALRERTIEVMMDKKIVSGKAFVEAHRTAHRSRKHLPKVGKAMMVRSLTKDADDVADKVYEWEGKLPDTMLPRPRFALSVVLMGLDYLEEVLTGVGITDLSEDFDNMRNGIVDPVVKAAEAGEHQTFYKSEVDIVVESLNSMAADDTARFKSGQHYLFDERELWLSLEHCMNSYRRWARDQGMRVAIRDTEQFSQLLQGEDYFDRTQKGEDGRKVWVILSAEGLSKRGISMDSYESGSTS